MNRVDGWHERLLRVIVMGESQPYVLGEFDCFRFACDCVSALTGLPSAWANWSSRYHDLDSALSLIEEYGGFKKAFSMIFGDEIVTWKYARRGDICASPVVGGTRHLGVCIGTKAVFLSESGLTEVPMSFCEWVWRIG